MKKKVVIIGAGYAGILCANRLEKQNQNVEISIISDSLLFQERIRFHEYASGKTGKMVPVQNLLRKKIEFLHGKVSKIEPNANFIQLETMNGMSPIPYDYLVVATGSSGIRFVSQTENSIQSKEALERFRYSKNPKDINDLCIIGAGLTGIELAAEWKESFPKTRVTLIDRNQFGKSFSKKGKLHLETALETLGVKILDSQMIESISSHQIMFQNKTKETFDTLVNCTGFQSSWILKESGFLTNEANQIYVDSFLRSKQFSNVFVCGDAAKLEHSTIRMGCVTALPMGAYVADTVSNTILGKKISPFSFQFFGRCVALGRRNGLIQFTHGDDSPKEYVIHGKLAAVLKEAVNRFTIFSIKMEKYLPFRFYFWPKGNSVYTENREITIGNQSVTGETKS